MPRCPTCDKPTALCVCALLQPLPTATRVLILQHPQEPDEVLGTAPLLLGSLPAATLRVGLAWASLSDALDEQADNAAWGVLWRSQLPRPLSPDEDAAPYLALDRHGQPRSTPFTGIIALDGTWSQAKTLWWRNPWLLKLGRVMLRPAEASIYGRIRREPRREAVSTLEAVADALVGNGEDPALRPALRRAMRTLVQRARDNPPPYRA